MSISKYGFVYLWFDRKHKRYYVGCRWGHVNDGYICSSSWMKNSYKRRPQDFKRRILMTNIHSKSQTLVEEHRFLTLIKTEELGKRYYNLTNHKNNHWSATSDAKTVGQKISASPNRAEKIRIANTGKRHSEETKEKLRQANIGKKLSSEHKTKIKANHKRDYSDPEFRRKMSEAAKNRSPEHRQKLSNITKQRRADGSLTGMKGLKHSEEAKARMSTAALRRHQQDMVL